ncbi:MAG: peptidylprolyl isomerase [Acidimicrobiales bacterium]
MNPIVVVVLCVLAVVALVAVAIVVVRDSGDDDVKTSAPSTTRAQAPTTTASAAVGYGTTACPPSGGTTGAVRTFASPFQKCIDVAKKYTAVVATNKGELTIQLDPGLAPIAVNNFVSLARSRYFDSTQCPSHHPHLRGAVRRSDGDRARRSRLPVRR